jgi:phosphatidate cytidylyltransferase
MALNWPTFFKRLGSAVVFSAIMMAGLLWNAWSFLALTALIQFLCLRDYFRLTHKISGTQRAPLLEEMTQVFALSVLVLVSFSVMPAMQEPAKKHAWPLLLFMPLLLLMAAALSKKNLWQNALEAMGGLIYIALPCILFLCLWQKDNSLSFAVPLALILMIWMNDTMAYLVGSFIGRTPFSTISPKKTWEGTAGGAILTIVGAAIWGYYSPVYRLHDWMVLALCAAVAGTAGDLLESKLKRMAGVKDSGAMMPGHGGALDRFDSLLVAVPFAFCYCWMFM